MREINKIILLGMCLLSQQLLGNLGLAYMEALPWHAFIMLERIQMLPNYTI